MTRVHYLAALEGAPGSTRAPLLRPPRRLFPHEPPPVEPLLPPSRPADRAAGGDPPTSERLALGPEPVAPERIRQEPAGSEPGAVPSVPAPSLDTPTAPSPAARRVEEILQPPVEAAPSWPQREAVLAAQAAAPQQARAATRATDPPSPVRREVRVAKPVPMPASREPAPARTVVVRRSAVTLEPSRLRPPVGSPPERASAASRPAAAAARAPGLRIGSIDVTVTPPPAAPREPAFAASPVHRSPAPFDPRGASSSRWFGLAQR